MQRSEFKAICSAEAAGEIDSEIQLWPLPVPSEPPGQCLLLSWAVSALHPALGVAAGAGVVKAQQTLATTPTQRVPSLPVPPQISGSLRSTSFEP